MKKVFVFFLCFGLLVSQSLAGGVAGHGKFAPKKVIAYEIPVVEDIPTIAEPEIKPIPPTPIPTIKLLKYPDAGWNVGFWGAMPTLGYADNDNDISAGYTSIQGDQSGVFRATTNFLQTNQAWTTTYWGVALIVDNGTAIAPLVGVQQYIMPNVSVFGDILLAVMSNNCPSYSKAVIGGRLYF